MTDKMKLYNPKEFWNIAAPRYCDPEYPESEQKWRNVVVLEHNTLFGLIDKIKPKNILQVGISFGLEIRELLKRDYIESITGADVSSKMIEYTRKNIGDNKKLKLVESDIIDLPFDNNTFDLVFTMACLTHVENVNKAIDQLIRVTKKDIVISENYINDKNEGASGIYRSDILDAPNHFLWDYEKRLIDKNLIINEKLITKGGLDFIYLYAHKKEKN